MRQQTSQIKCYGPVSKRRGSGHTRLQWKEEGILIDQITYVPTQTEDHGDLSRLQGDEWYAILALRERTRFYPLNWTVHPISHPERHRIETVSPYPFHYGFCEQTSATFPDAHSSLESAIRVLAREEKKKRVDALHIMGKEMITTLFSIQSDGQPLELRFEDKNGVLDVRYEPAQRSDGEGENEQ